MSNLIFRFQHRVTYGECTVGNHVYYSRYFDFLEAARGEFFRSSGRTLVQWQEREYLFPVIEARARYKASARYDDTVTVELWLYQLEGVRVGFDYRLINEQGQLLAEASTAHVCASLREKPKRIPPDLICQIGAYLRATGCNLPPPVPHAHGTFNKSN